MYSVKIKCAEVGGEKNELYEKNFIACYNTNGNVTIDSKYL